MVTNWTQLVLGVWLLISPWLLGYANISLMKWSNVLLGLVLVLINVWTIFGEKKVAEVNSKGN